MQLSKTNEISRSKGQLEQSTGEFAIRSQPGVAGRTPEGHPLTEQTQETGPRG